MPGMSGSILSELPSDQFNIPFVFFSVLDTEEAIPPCSPQPFAASSTFWLPKTSPAYGGDRASSSHFERYFRSSY